MSDNDEPCDVNNNYTQEDGYNDDITANLIPCFSSEEESVVEEGIDGNDIFDNLIPSDSESSINEEDDNEEEEEEKKRKKEEEEEKMMNEKLNNPNITRQHKNYHTLSKEHQTILDKINNNNSSTSKKRKKRRRQKQQPQSISTQQQTSSSESLGGPTIKNTLAKGGFNKKNSGKTTSSKHQKGKTNSDGNKGKKELNHKVKPGRRKQPVDPNMYHPIYKNIKGMCVPISGPDDLIEKEMNFCNFFPCIKCVDKQMYYLFGDVNGNYYIPKLTTLRRLLTGVDGTRRTKKGMNPYNKIEEWDNEIGKKIFLQYWPQDFIVYRTKNTKKNKKRKIDDISTSTTVETNNIQSQTDDRGTNRVNNDQQQQAKTQSSSSLPWPPKKKRRTTKGTKKSRKTSTKSTDTSYKSAIVMDSSNYNNEKSVIKTIPFFDPSNGDNLYDNNNILNEQCVRKPFLQWMVDLASNYKKHSTIVPGEEKQSETIVNRKPIQTWDSLFDKYHSKTKQKYTIWKTKSSSSSNNNINNSDNQLNGKEIRIEDGFVNLEDSLKMLESSGARIQLESIFYALHVYNELNEK